MVYIARNNAEEKPAVVPSADGSIFGLLTPKMAFVMGLIATLMTVCSVGFVILLINLFKG